MMRPSFRTPRTALSWATLEEWLDGARTIDRRRASALRNRQAELHVRALIVAIANRMAQIDRAEDHASIGLGHNSRNAPAV